MQAIDDIRDCLFKVVCKLDYTAQRELAKLQNERKMEGDPLRSASRFSAKEKNLDADIRRAQGKVELEAQTNREKERFVHP
ncbi:unnamed protein product, partial [Amoebophrya sp. A120]|eukprot:GSA120T00025652001.1